MALTKLDVIKEKGQLVLHDDLSNIYDNVKIKQVMDELAHGSKTQKNDIFPIVNYGGIKEKRDLKKEVLALNVLYKGIRLILAYLSKMKFVNFITLDNKKVQTVMIKSLEMKLSILYDRYSAKFNSKIRIAEFYNEQNRAIIFNEMEELMIADICFDEAETKYELFKFNSVSIRVLLIGELPNIENKSSKKDDMSYKSSNPSPKTQTPNESNKAVSSLEKKSIIIKNKDSNEQKKRNLHVHRTLSWTREFLQMKDSELFYDCKNDLVNKEDEYQIITKNCLIESETVLSFGTIPLSVSTNKLPVTTSFTSYI